MPTLADEDSYHRLPIHVITGFLGSGKTSLLNRLLKQPAMQRAAIIVNEFGEVGMDNLLVQASSEDIVMLDGGCLCCAVRGDLLNTLEDLFRRRRAGEIPVFDQVLIETTGLADPAPILRTLLNDEFVIRHYRLDVVVTTVDAVYAMRQLGTYDESVKQVALAHHLIITKSDLVESPEVETLRAHLSSLNPAARLWNIQEEDVDAGELFKVDYYRGDNRLDPERWLAAEAYLDPARKSFRPAGERHDAYLRSFCLEKGTPLSWLVLERWIRQLTRLRGKDLLRVKGIAWTRETELPVVIQGVQHIFQPPTTLTAWPPGPRRSRIVFITRNLEREVVEHSLETLMHSHTPEQVCRAAMILLGETPSVKVTQFSE